MPYGIHESRRGKLTSVQLSVAEMKEVKELMRLEEIVYGVPVKRHHSVMSAVRMRIENLKLEVDK